MDLKTIIKELWKAYGRYDWEQVGSYFCENAEIKWHDKNVKLTVSEFLKSNENFSGLWENEIERLECIDNHVTSVTKVSGKFAESEEQFVYHVISFFKFQNGKIVELDEYWGRASHAPAWDTKFNIGSPIQKMNSMI